MTDMDRTIAQMHNFFDNPDGPRVTPMNDKQKALAKEHATTRMKPGPKSTTVRASRAKYNGQPVPKAVSRVWVVNNKGSLRAFVSEAGANRFAARCVNELAHELLPDNFYKVSRDEIPEATANNFREVLRVIDVKLRYTTDEIAAITEMGVFE